MAEETLTCSREKLDGEYVYVHSNTEGNVRIICRPCDQRPDADGLTVFRPICVAEILHNDIVWNYHKYCGSCRQLMGSLGEIKECCPRCGKQIGHYRFEMGVENHHGNLPDIWP